MARGKYARKRQLQQLRSCLLTDTVLSARVVKALEKANIITVADLIICSDVNLKNIAGIGEKALQEIICVRENYRKVEKT